MTHPTSQRATLLQAYRTIERLEAKLKAAEEPHGEPIAIVGLAGRYPGGADLDAFWQTLDNGVDASSDHPADRWDLAPYYDPTPGTPGKVYIRRGAYVADVDKFDARFFGISPREADNLDPQQRLVLETSWEALEHANLPPDQLQNTRTGVYVGVSNNDYMMLALDRIGIDQYAGFGSDVAPLAGRLSYLLGLQGPSMTLMTMCSSSSVAIHLASQALKARECDLALAGGVHLNLSPHSTVDTCLIQAVSADGRCKSFSANANGYGRGEGCGMVALKRLSDAVAAGDLIHAVLRGSAVNHDGPSGAFTVPNGPAQEAVIQQALAFAQADPTEISYVEAHGTGTPLGDPIEARALSRVYGKGRTHANPLLIGSVKSNISHTEAASGVAGVIKVVLALQHHALPASLHFDEPNPHIDWTNSPLRVVNERMPWPRKVNGPVRMAGVSSFGMTGTNTHLIIAEPPPPPHTNPANPSTSRPYHLLTLSAKTPAALQALADRYVTFLKQRPADDLADVAFTSHVGRNHHAYRLCVVAATPQSAQEKLAAWQTGDTAGVVEGQVGTGKGTARLRPKVAFLFTGQGAQYRQMGRQLYATEPVFRTALDRCNELLRPHLETPLLEVLYPGVDDAQLAQIDDTAYTQPALFALEYALAQLWLAWGIQPDLVMGHSVGEYVAACIAGVFSLEEGLHLIAARGRLMGALPTGGAMLAVAANVEEVRHAIAPYLAEIAIAAINAPQNVVISGRKEAVDAVRASLEAAGVKTTPLTVSHAFHSPLMEPMLADFAAVARTIQYASPRIKLVSNLTGKLAASTLATPEYWVQHVRQPVAFAAGMATLQAQGCQVFIEIGPKPTLLGMGRQSLDSSTPETEMPHAPTLWLPSLRPGQEEWQTLLTSLGTLYSHGHTVDWQGLDRQTERRKVVLPTYPFQRQRYWLREDLDLPTRTTQPARQTLRPLIDRMVRSPLLDGIVFETTLTLHQQPFLAAHQVHGQVVMAGAAYLSTVIDAVELLSGSPQCTLEEIVFRKGLVVTPEQPQTLQLIFKPVPMTAKEERHNGHPGDGTPPPPLDDATSSFVFEIISFATNQEHTQPTPFLRHATGRVTLTPGGQPLPASVSAWQAQCPHAMEGTALYQQLEQGGVQWGTSFRWLTTCWWNEQGSSLGQLQPPPHDPNTLTFALHPGLLDSCFQMAGFAPTDDTRTFVPVALGQLHFYRKPQGNLLWCYAEPVGPQQWDLKLAEADGTFVAKLKGYEVAEVRAESFAAALPPPAWQDWLYQIAWQPAALPQPASEPSSEPGHWLVFADRQGVGKELAHQLAAQGQSCVIVTPDPLYQSSVPSRSGLYTRTLLNPLDPEQVTRLLQEQQQAGHTSCRLLYLWSAEAAGETESEVETAQLHSLALLRLVQAVNATGMAARLWVVTRGAQPVAERSVQQAAAAALWGLARTISLEQAELAPICIDLAPLDEKIDPAAALAAEATTLCRELLTTTPAETQRAFAHGNRYVARLARTPVPPAAPTLAPDGSYLITGGLGGLGLKVAEWLVAQGARHLVLAGRSAPSPQAQEVLEQLQRQGAQITVVQADVSEEAAVARLLAACTSPLRGVIHTAGVLRDGLLLQQTAENFAQVMAAKVAGAWYLHQMTRDRMLDFFVLFSSAASVFGSLGQGNYAAANAFLDGLAHYRRSLGLPALSINWGSWAEVGMAARLDARQQARIAEQGESLLAPEAGLQVLAALLQQPATQVTVSAIQWPAFLAPFAATTLPPFYTNFAQHPPAPPQAATGPTTPSNLSRALAALDAAGQQQHLVAYLQRTFAAIVGQSPAEIGVTTPLPALGLDSLMAIDVRNQTKRDLGVDVPIVKLLESITLTELALWLNRAWQDAYLQTDAPPADSQAAAEEPLFEEVVGEL